MKKQFTDAEMKQGGGFGDIFIITAEGGVWRRRPDPIDAGDYGCYGHINPAIDTPELRAAMLGELRTARKGNAHSKSSAANVKQTRAIVKRYNGEEA